ncbi:5774_t:CDS:2 [Ambispora gerdemannii]|uniref:5774_t:CDS:1 n=1 Tax=Ambispora gerdemannii TaxID=144530 RepID=A0A9N9G0M6_9GLOM|nr:5774_t:CDS:2 [Ambispora gerdemannii]
MSDSESDVSSVISSDTSGDSEPSEDSEQTYINNTNGSKGKKRQLEEEVTLSVDMSEDNDGPALAWFPGVIPPEETEYKLYVRSEAKDAKLMKQKILFGETNYVELNGVNYSELKDMKDMYGYLVGVYDKETSTVTLKEIPVFNFSVVVKKRKLMKKPESSVKKSYAEARADLGRTFGNKKLIQRINDAEKNAVYADMVEASTRDSIIQTVEDKLQMLPSTEQVNSDIDANRNIPPYNAQATEPANVYKLEDIVPTNELNMVPIKQILDATTSEEALQLFPFKNSKYITSHLLKYWNFKFDQQTRRKIQILVYISYLMCFSSHQKTIERRGEVAKSLNSPPRKMTPVLQNKLYSYAFVLCLILDEYVLDPTNLANDLCVAKQRINDIFKSLGCRVDKLTKEERETAGFTAVEARSMKRARLQAPPVFPVKKQKK